MISNKIAWINRIGGASRDRTDDPLLAKQVLSQLSYGPGCFQRTGFSVPLLEVDPPKMVGLGRLELPTSPLSGVRSNHLSYRPQQWVERRIRPDFPGLSLGNSDF